MMLLVFLALCAGAGEREEKIGRKIIEGAAKAGVQDMARQALDKQIVVAGTSNVATKALGVVGVFNGVKSFGEANDDRGRFWATASTATSTIAMINPAVGLVVGIVTMVLQTVDTLINADSAAKVAEIYKKIAEDLAEITKIEKQFLEGEKAWLVATMDAIEKAEGQIKVTQASHKAECVDKPVVGLESLTQCIDFGFTVLRYKRAFLHQYRSILNHKFERISEDGFFKAFGKSRAEMERMIAEYEPQLERREGQLYEYISALSKNLVAEYLKASQEAGQTTAAEHFVEQCETDQSEFIQQVALLLAGESKLVKQSKIRSFIGDLNVIGAVQLGEALQARCESEVIHNEGLNIRLTRSNQVLDLGMQSLKKVKRI